MNVLRYCYLDGSLKGEASLICDSALERLLKTKELDFLSYIVLRMFENTEVANFFLPFHKLKKQPLKINEFCNILIFFVLVYQIAKHEL